MTGPPMNDILEAFRKTILGVALALLPAVGFASDIDARYAALIDIEERAIGRLSTLERGARVADAFEHQFGSVSGEPLARLGDDDLAVYFRATELVLFNTQAIRHLEKMEAAFSEAAARHQLSGSEIEAMHKAYVSMRRFDEAAALRGRNGWVPSGTQPDVASRVPADFRGRTVLEVDADDPLLTRVPYLHPLERRIVVVSHPMCQFTQRAIAAIEQDGELRDLFDGRTTWLAPVEGNLRFDVMRRWNETRPAFAMALAFSRDDWPEIDAWGTPTFYFFGEEGVVAKVAGWPEEGRRAELLAAARQAGIVAPVSPVTVGEGLQRIRE